MIRNLLFDQGLLQQWKAEVPVISVGNITTGGTGKTPLVENLVRYLLSQGKRIAVISRGYKRDGSGPVYIAPGIQNRGNSLILGDEPYQMARKFPQIAVLVDANRKRAAELASKKYHAQVIILDDGFQHRALNRDLNIVMVDRSIQLEKMPLLPAGMLREPVTVLKRAHVIAYIGSSDGNEREQSSSKNSKPSITVVRHPVKFHSMQAGIECSIADSKGKRCIAFCGIGKPESFKRSLESIGLEVCKMIVFPDHHYFTDVDLKNIRSEFIKYQPDWVVTTEKDASRIDSVMAGLLPKNVSYYLEIEAVINDGAEMLHAMIQNILKDTNG